MTAVAEAIGISRQHLSAMRNRPPLPDAELVADLPTYGYRRVHALLRRQAQQTGRAAPNSKRAYRVMKSKRAYRVMKVQGLLLQPQSGKGKERCHDSRVSVDWRNTRWCSDALEIGCDNGEKVRVAFALDRPIEGDWPYVRVDATDLKVRRASRIVSVAPSRATGHMSGSTRRT